MKIFRKVFGETKKNENRFSSLTNNVDHYSKQEVNLVQEKFSIAKSELSMTAKQFSNI